MIWVFHKKGDPDDRTQTFTDKSRAPIHFVGIISMFPHIIRLPTPMSANISNTNSQLLHLLVCLSDSPAPISSRFDHPIRPHVDDPHSHRSTHNNWAHFHTTFHPDQHHKSTNNRERTLAKRFTCSHSQWPVARRSLFLFCRLAHCLHSRLPIPLLCRVSEWLFIMIFRVWHSRSDRTTRYAFSWSAWFLLT